MDKIVKELSGHSGSTIYLMENTEKVFVRKIGNVDRNYERLILLWAEGYRVPKIYKYGPDEILDMEYIHGLDIKNYLIHNNVNLLTNFLCDIIDSFSDNSVYKDYTEVYNHKLSYLSGNEGLTFTKEQLIDRLPKKLPQSTYHGDMTLENILYTNPGFCMIDPLMSEYDSYIFDIAKLRQDLECKWFIRKLNVKIDTKLQRIQEKLKKWYPDAFDDSLLILMLLRVYPYCDDADKQFIVNEANRLWKL